MKSESFYAFISLFMNNNIEVDFTFFILSFVIFVGLSVLSFNAMSVTFASFAYLNRTHFN